MNNYEDPNFEEFVPNSKSLGELYPEALKELLIPYPSIELPGWKLFNEMVGGFRMREFSILCGSTGSGKTTLLSHFAKSLLIAGKRCFVMSVETGHTDFIKRTMSAFAQVDLNRGISLTPEVLKLFHAKHGSFFSSDGLFLSLYDSRINYKTVLKEIEWHKEHKKCEIVFIDNLNFLLDVVSSNRQIEVMDTVIHDLIMFAKRTDVHIVMVMHPKKTDGGRVESEFDIKGSSTAVQEAHNVFLFNRPKQKDIERHGSFARELTIAKLRRRGESIGKSLWLRYQNSHYQEICIENRS